MAVRKVVRKKSKVKKSVEAPETSQLPVFEGTPMPMPLVSQGPGAITFQDATLTVTQNLGVIPSFWGVDNNTIAELSRAGSIVGSQYGLASAVPLICRGDSCPYLEACAIDPAIRSYSAGIKGRCLMEIAALADRMNRYINYFMITEDDVIDMGLVRELVDIEVQILRCDNLNAIDGNFIEMVIAGVSNQGKEYHRPELRQSVELKQKLRNERHRIYKLLDSTREDKAKRMKINNDPSILAAELTARMVALEQAGMLKTVFVTEAEALDVDYKEAVDEEFAEEIEGATLNEEGTPPEAPVDPQDLLDL